MRVFRNIAYDWFRLIGSTEYGVQLTANSSQAYTNVRILHNHFQQPCGGITSRVCIMGITWSDNLYWEDPSTALCSHLSCNGEACGAPLFQLEEVNYTAPGRDIAAYMASIGHPSSGVAEFMDLARKQVRWNWDDRFTAHAVLNYLRQGFDRPALAGRPHRILYEIDYSGSSGYAIATPLQAWSHHDFVGVEFDDSVGKLYAICTRKHALDGTTAVYELDPDPQVDPIERAEVNVHDMQGIAMSQGEFFVVSGEDKAIRRYSLSTGQLTGTIASPITDDELGGTFGGAGILFFPWP